MYRFASLSISPSHASFLKTEDSNERLLFRLSDALMREDGAEVLSPSEPDTGLSQIPSPELALPRRAGEPRSRLASRCPAGFRGAPGKEALY